MLQWLIGAQRIVETILFPKKLGNYWSSVKTEKTFLHHFRQTPTVLTKLCRKKRKYLNTNRKLAFFVIFYLCTVCRSFVVLLCPCDEKVCINKCCPEGYYYNEKDKECKKAKDDNIQAYRPAFYQFTQETEELPYFLKQGHPKCDKPDTLIKKNITDKLTFYLQSNLTGSLMIDDDKEDVYIFYSSERWGNDFVFKNNK